MHTLKTIVISVSTSIIVVGLIVYGAFNRLDAGLQNILIQTTNPEESEAAIHSLTIPDVVDDTIPAVVSIVITAEIPIIERYYENYSPFGDWFGNGFAVPRQREIGTEEREIGGGTGFIVSPDGYIITNRHVVDQNNVEYSVVTNDGETYGVEILAKDPTLDIAILKIESETDLPYLSFGSTDNLRLGETTIAIGNALAEFPNSVSVGVISGLARDIIAGDGYGASETLEGLIQTDAAINQGNSGGPLLNAAGEVVGVNVAMAGNSENIGFALPADSVQVVFESVRDTGEIIRPFVGVRYLQITKEIAEQNNLAVDYGIIVIRGDNRGELAVIPGSPADKAGLEENDIILEIDGVKLDGSRSFVNLLRDYQVGNTITLDVLHDGEQKEVIVTLEKADTE